MKIIAWMEFLLFYIIFVLYFEYQKNKELIVNILANIKYSKNMVKININLIT